MDRSKRLSETLERLQKELDKTVGRDTHLIYELEKQARLLWAGLQSLQESTADGDSCFYGITPMHSPRWLDHGSFWDFEGKPAVMVGQPYQMKMDDIKEAIRHADKYGLEINIDTYPAWHFPGSALFVTLWNPEIIALMPI